MSEVINFIIVNLILDFLITYLIKKMFKLKTRIFELVFLQVLNASVVVIYLFCGLKFYQFLLLKILANVLISLLITDSFNIKNLFKLIVSYCLIMFSIYGFSKFLTLFAKCVIFQLFDIKIAKYLEFCLIFAFLAYYLIIYKLLVRLSEEKTFKSLLSKVSFFLHGKHIEFTGLLDSGNSLYDTKTGKAVIVVSLKFLQQHFENLNYETLLKNGFCSHEIKCVSAGGNLFDLPVIDVGEVVLKKFNEEKIVDCVLGIVNQKFYDEKKYDCLLHRDFF